MLESPDMPDAVIEFRNVSYLINDGSLRPILTEISVEITDGEVVALLGRSGSGKTTMLKMINRIRVFTSGDILVAGRSIRMWDLIQLRRRIGYVIQETGLFPHLSIEENVCIVPKLENWSGERMRARFREVMDLVGLHPEEYGPRYPRELSGGQKQRVGVARALAADPAILLMDEPFGALDPVTRAELQQVFLDLARRVSKTIVFVTHDLREALLLGTRIVLLDGGQIAASTTAKEFLKLDHPIARQFIAASQLVVGAVK